MCHDKSRLRNGSVLGSSKCADNATVFKCSRTGKQKGRPRVDRNSAALCPPGRPRGDGARHEPGWAQTSGPGTLCIAISHCSGRLPGTRYPLHCNFSLFWPSPRDPPRCFGPVRPSGRRREPSDPIVLCPGRRFSAQLTHRETMDGPALLSWAWQARHAAAAGHPPELPQRTSSSLVDSGLGGVGGDVVFFAGARRVPFTPKRAAWKKLHVSHYSGASHFRHPDLLASTSSSSTMPPGSLASSSSSSSPWNLKPHQNFQMPRHAPRSSQVQEWEVAPARVVGPGCKGKVYARDSKRNVCAFESTGDGVRGATQVYEREKTSSSSRASHLSHLKWWIERCKVRRCAPYPLIVHQLQYAASLLKNSK